MLHESTTMRHFGELRSLLNAPPSELGWHTLCDALAGVSAALFEEELFPYIQPYLDRSWPDTLRLARPHWLERFLRGEPAPQLLLCRRLYAHHLTLAEVRALGHAPQLAALTHLDLYSNPLGPKLCHLLAKPACFPALTHLDLSYDQVGDKGARALADAPRAAMWRSLRLDQNGISDDGAQALARSKHLKNLDFLSLYNNDLGHWGVEELRRSTTLKPEVRRMWAMTEEL